MSFSPSTCEFGRLILAASATSTDKNWFWSTIMTAKSTGKVVGVAYDVVGTDCVVSNFYIQ